MDALRCTSWLVLAMVLGCHGSKDTDTGQTNETAIDGDADTDADSDADSDADVDVDTDADTDTALSTGDTGTTIGTGRVMPTTGSGVTLSADGTLAVVANRTSNEVTLLSLDLTVSPATASTLVTFGENDAEPWAAVLNTDASQAFVVERKAQSVLRIDDPATSASKFATRAVTDSEPSGIAISPNGTTLYVANFGEGTVSVIDTATMVTTSTVDLNQSLVDSGVLGGSVTTSRPGLAHPMGIAVTNDGDTDDADEEVFVTEFFAQDLPTATFADDSFFDTNHQGFVYWFDTGTLTSHTPISLGASTDMGFVDSNGATAGCFPNQLFSVAIDGTRLYVSGVCTSPRGPANPGASDPTANFKTKIETAVYVVDTVNKTESVGQRLLTNQLWNDGYVSGGFADDNTRRFPLMTNAMAFVPGTHILYLSAYGADAMFRIEFDATGNLVQVGSGLNKFVDLQPGGGKLPYGISIVPGQAVLVNENTRNLSIVDLGLQAVESTVPCATAVNLADQTAVNVNDGRRFFVTGTGRWSLNGQAWNSCEGCHPFGLTDNVTWFFAAGPRSTTPLDGSFDADGTARLLNWTAINDEFPDFEGNVRGISGGVGALVWDNTGALLNDDRIVIDGTAISGNQVATDTLQAGLNGSTFEVIDPGVDGNTLADPDVLAKSVQLDWQKIDDYVHTIRAPKAPVTLDSAAVAAGRTLFETQKCTGCHAGPNWTISNRFYTPSQATNDATTGTLSIDTYSRGTLPVGMNPASDAGNATLRGGGTIQCALRALKTFPDSGTTGVAPAGVTVSERKDDMVNTATGINGFSPPSLLGEASYAPYFHAGNARTLEETLDSTFIGHYRAFSANFTPSATDIANLTAFLLSIDDTTVEETVDAGTIDPVVCPDP